MHSRRGFLAGGLASLGTFGMAKNVTPADAVQPQFNEGAVLDYGRSFICNPASFNSVRFWVESRTTIYDDKAGTSSVFYQCGSCKSENTFGEKDLLYADNYDFLPIWGDGQWLVFRRPIRLSATYREVTGPDKKWGDPILKLRAGRDVKLLRRWDEIDDATTAADPIVSRTELKNDETGLRAVIECPVKTMNVSRDRHMYQVDTGPVAFPDLTKRYDKPIDSLSLAYVVFNADHFADFVIEQPTPVVEDGVEKCQVYHYSKPFSLPAQNWLYAIGTENG
jgi:hypothetical protein